MRWVHVLHTVNLRWSFLGGDRFDIFTMFIMYILQYLELSADPTRVRVFPLLLILAISRILLD